MSSKDKKTRIAYLTQGRVYHLCTIIICHDLSILITMPSGVKTTSSFPITMKDEKPIAGELSPISSTPIKFSYHPKTGFKHIKETTAGERLATYNSSSRINSKNIFESLLRIFPTNPEKLPFIPKARSTDIIIPDTVNKGNPVSLLFSATTADNDQITIEAPPETVAFPILGFNNFTVIVTILPLTQDNKPQNTWPEMTIWTTPY